MENEKPPGVIESLFDRTTDYIETRAELLKLKAVKGTSEIVSGLVSKIVLIVVFCFFLMVLNIALGLWLGEMLDKTYYGFFALSGFYLIVGLIIYASRKSWLVTPVANSIIKKIS
ncbi:MAG: phage holin family protein [Ferruginibacter sp.]